jgi:hypothetical protein
MDVVKIAPHKGCSHLCLKSDSMLVSLAFKSLETDPWQMKSRQKNCVHMISSNYFIVSHIHIKENHCVNKLTNLGLGVDSSIWWYEMSSQTGGDYSRNRLRLSFFYFINNDIPGVRNVCSLRGGRGLLDNSI